MIFGSVFFSAPHRVMFAGGVVQSLLAMLFWAGELAARQFSLPWPVWPWPPTWLHAGLMLFGIFPWFIFGFLMTALPKWMAAPPLSRRRYLPPFLLMAAGWLLFWAGQALPPLALAGLALVAAGWAAGAWALWRATGGSRNDRRHARAVLAALGSGVIALLVYVYALAGSDAAAFRVAVELGLWACLTPLFFIVLHRMLPFFTAAVLKPYVPYQPYWGLWAMLAALAVHGLLAAAGATAWRWPADALAAGLAWHLWRRWWANAVLAVPMLAMLHLGALWLAAALSLYTLQGVLAAAGIVWGGLLPLHALGIGFFASLLIGMATRVTLGHSGRPIGGDRRAWPLFKLLQAVVALRLAGEFVPAANLPAALGWLTVFGAWAAAHLPMYLRPRPDGEAG